MVVIRPIGKKDWHALWDMAQKTGPGFSSLQPQEEQVARRFQHALDSFSEEGAKKEALYLFVLEDLETKNVIGIAAIESALGLDDPWYNFRINTVVHASQRFGVFNPVKTLTLCNDYTGCSDLCTLFLLPQYRNFKGAGHLLSKSRFLFMAEHPDCFSECLIAELRGYSNEQGESPFWEALGRKFIGLDFIEADQELSNNRSFITELMPRHPIYVNMLAEEAQKVIGQTHEQTLPALKLLEAEGMKYRNYIAPFDAGPVVEAQTKDVRAIRESFMAEVKIIDKLPSCSKDNWLISNAEFSNFRCILAPLVFNEKYVMLTDQQIDALNISEGDAVRLVSKYPGEKMPGWSMV